MQMPQNSEKFTEKPYYRATLSMVKNTSHNAYALDVGCGENPCFFDDHVSNYIGMDINTVTLKKVRTALPKANLICGSGSNMPFKNDVFDVAICTEVLEHLENPENMVKEISRILIRGGTAIISIPSLSLPQTIILWIAHKTRKISGKPYQSPDHVREYARFIVTPHFENTSDLFRLFKREGLEIRNVEIAQSLYVKPTIVYTAFLSKFEKAFEKIFSRHLIGHHTIFKAEKK
jgi:ubiquinone/menaquinone biosynthesis C-methylase UbiE